MGDRKCDTSYATGGVSLWSGEPVNYALPWIYYSSQILLLGAEFNQVLRRAGRSRVCSRQIRCSVVALGPWGDAILCRTVLAFLKFLFGLGLTGELPPGAK